MNVAVAAIQTAPIKSRAFTKRFERAVLDAGAAKVMAANAPTPARSAIIMRRAMFILLISIMCLWVTTTFADERIWLDAKINNHPVRLIFDTGADGLILFAPTAERLGLKVAEPPPGIIPDAGKVVGGTTEDCTMSIQSVTTTVRFQVVNSPDYLHWDGDGVVGWNALYSGIFCIDALAKNVVTLSDVPAEATSWLRFPVATNSILALAIPHGSNPATSLFIDTGSFSGVALCPGEWREWSAANINQQATLQAYYMPGAGLVVTKEMWAGELAFGPLSLTDVPVMEANSARVALGGRQYEASLGLAALKRLDLIIDGRQGVAYVRPKTSRPVSYPHNRWGAVFVPRDGYGNDLGACVAEGGPAWNAGIWQGDVLLKIGELDVSKWQTDPAILPLSRFWERPPGTRFELSILRGDTIRKFSVRLQQILPPESSEPSNTMVKQGPAKFYEQNL